MGKWQSGRAAPASNLSTRFRRARRRGACARATGRDTRKYTPGVAGAALRAAGFLVLSRAVKPFVNFTALVTFIFVNRHKIIPARIAGRRKTPGGRLWNGACRPGSISAARRPGSARAVIWFRYPRAGRLFASPRTCPSWPSTCPGAAFPCGRRIPGRS